MWGPSMLCGTKVYPPVVGAADTDLWWMHMFAAAVAHLIKVGCHACLPAPVLLLFMLLCRGSRLSGVLAGRGALSVHWSSCRLRRRGSCRLWACCCMWRMGWLVLGLLWALLRINSLLTPVIGTSSCRGLMNQMSCSVCIPCSPCG